MKKIFLFLLLSSLSVLGQQFESKWNKVIENENAGKIKSANAIVENIYKKASRQKDEAQIIKCFFYLSKYSQVLDENAQTKIIRHLKNEINSASIPTKAILNLIYGKCLNSYYQQNGYTIRNRTNIANADGDFLTWTKVDFEKQTVDAYAKSLENQTILKQTPLNNYSAIFDYADDTTFKKQTLFDYLIKENIAFYTSRITTWEVNPKDFQTYQDILYGNSAQFSILNLDFITNENLKKALELYQTQEINTSTSEKQLQRIIFVKNYILKSENEWLTVLENLQKTVTNEAITQQIQLEKANSYIQQASKETHPDYNNKAIAVLDSIIATNNRSNSYKKAVQNKHDLNLKSIHIELEKYIYPSQNSRARITYKNVDSVSISFYKLAQSEINLFEYNYQLKDSILNDLVLNKIPIASQKYTLKNQKNYFEYSTEVLLPQLDLGTYLVFFESNNDKKDSKAFGYETVTVSNFTIIAGIKSNKEYYQVLDRKSGQPIEDVTIASNKLTLITNREGKVTYDKKDVEGSYLDLSLTKQNDTLDLADKWVNHINVYKELQKAKAKVEIYLDRAIYRPGQTVYYKGVAFQKKQDKSSVVPHTTFKIRCNDASGNTLKEFDVITNEFGSFSGEYVLPKSGLTGNFKIEAGEPDNYKNDVNYSYTLEEHPFWDQVEFENSFQVFAVEEYKRPKFEVSIDRVTGTYNVNDKITITGNANSFTGSVLSGAKVKYTVRQETYNSNFNGRYEWAGGRSQTITESETTTDDKGKFSIDFIAVPDTYSKKEDLPIFSYRISIAVTDNNGETHSINQQLVTNVGYHALKLVATLPYDIETKNKNILSLDSKNLNDTFVPTIGVLKFYCVRKSKHKIKPRIWKKPEIESISETEFETLFPFEQNDIPISKDEMGELVFTKNVNTDRDKKIALHFMSDWEAGTYNVVFSAVDKFGNAVDTKTRFNLAQSSETFNPNTLFTAEQLNSNPAKDGFIKVKLKSIMPSLYISSSANYKNWNFYDEGIAIDNNEAIITIPLLKEFEKAITVNFTSIFDNTVFEKKLEVILENTQPKLDFEVTSFRSKLEPAKLESWSFKLNPNATNIETEVLASMYDKSLDQFAKQDWGLFNFNNDNNYYSSNTKTILGFEKTYSNIYNLNTNLNAITFQNEYTDLLWFGFNINTVENKYTLINYKKQHPIKLKGPSNAKLISGIISDSSGVLSGAGISIKGTERKTVSDFDGYYQIAAAQDEILVFSYIGYNSKEQKITTKIIDIQLQQDESDLQEVVVVGYGIVKKKSSSSSVVVVEDNSVYNTAGIAIALEGRAAGVSISNLKMNIRGTGAIDKNTVPLYIVDGQITTEQEIKNLIPDDIVSIDVLKEAKATAIYGSKGANGAIIITTKKALEGLTQVKARTNLSETAFFLPNLKTDKNGNLSFNFTSPEALTAWKFRLLAHNKEAVSGYLEKNVITQKELMVIPNFPRFFREKDSIIITSKVANMTKEAKTGIAQLQFLDATTMEAVDVAMANTKSVKNFKISPMGSTTVSWKVYVPTGLEGIQYKIVAKAGNYSDGEESILPVLTNNILVTESMPIWVRENSKKEYIFENLKNSVSPTLKNHQFTFEYTSNPAWIAIQSLPYLMEYEHDGSEQTFARFYANALATTIISSNPKIAAIFESWRKDGKDHSKLEDNEELKSIILAETPWINDAKSEEEKKKNMALLFDLEKMKSSQDATFDILKKKQTASGGFPWFEGGEPSEYITRHIVAGLGHLSKLSNTEDSTAKIKQIASKAIPFIDEKFLTDYQAKNQNTQSTTKLIWNNPCTDLHYLYSRSFYLESYPLSDSLQTATKQYIEIIKTNWLNYSLYEKGLAALTLNRFGEKIVAKKIIESLKEIASNNEDWGMYWIANKAGWYWYQAPIETQALLIEAFAEVTKDNKSVDAMKVWLLKNKQTKNWPTTKSTTEAVYALLLQGSDWLSIKDNTTIKIGDEKILTKKLNDNQKEAETGYIKLNWKAAEINKDMAIISINNKASVPAYGGVYWQYFEDLEKVKSDNKNSLSITKELYLKKDNKKGSELTKVTGDLTIGDLVTVRLIISTKEDMEFVHLKDMRASCFEPIDVLSSYQYKDNLGFYKSTKDAATHFFFDKINKGTYVLEYDIRVNNKGSFSNGITTIQSMYAPEFTSHSNGIQVKVSN
ncbi:MULTISPECIES: MG2 domain-containing protein [unclassified Flavobacterium]|uniref:alpha-2-macroglobulin family protein n=1 Tax=unclassified Flavobacterium TaxID=196869 RepID=UPI003F9165D9